MDVLTIQKTLQGLGFDPGPLDGIWGRLTMAAIKAFQRQNGLEVDGIVGPMTERALRQGPQPAAHPASGYVWLDEAQRLKGTLEYKTGSNPVILDWAKDLDIAYQGDDIAWCGLFVGHCIAATLPDEPLPNGVLGARNWLKFGTPTQPGMGAVLVFWRESKKGSKGHVGFYVGEDNEAYNLLGGNQSDKVSVARISKSRLLGARWPSTAQTLAGGTVRGSGLGGLSVNEQ